MQRSIILLVCVLCLMVGGVSAQFTFPDTGQPYCYDVSGASTPCPQVGEPLFGQDANYQRQAPSFTDNGDGTITDTNTGLMWQQDPGGKVTWDDAMANADSINIAGYTDWRVPTITELYSLMDFSGYTAMSAAASIPYIDTDYFIFEYGDESSGERFIDAQFWSSTEYVSTTMNGNSTVFGVNFADGRIKGYPKSSPGRGVNLNFVRYVRGSSGYGMNDFVDNGDGTITDGSTGLNWMQGDGGPFNWADALAYCENLSLAGADDWRLPDAKELQYLVDYARAPDTTNSAAINPIFSVTAITDEGGGTNYPFYWTSTTHLDGRNPGDHAVYIAFGEALGFMDTDNPRLMDVHGAGAQRSDPKAGDPSQYPSGFGPQADVIRIFNYARCVRGGSFSVIAGNAADPTTYSSGQAPPDGQTPPGQGAGGQRPQGQGPDFAAAAAQLGITEQALRAALGPPPPDFAAAAAQLGITEQALRNALGVQAGGNPGQGPPQG